MKLSRFITDHIEEILVEWDAFAKTLRPAAQNMSASALRDDARNILEAIAIDIDSNESAKQQDEKSKGLAPQEAGADSAASEHGTLRQLSGFSLLQLTAEYRALRASVLRLWLPQLTHSTDASTNDIVRFNETIDQALAESVVTYSERTDQVRDTFLAVLGHDLRSPLATMAMAGDMLCRPELGPDRTMQVGVRVKRSAATMNIMVGDLLEYARTQLGGEMPIVPQLADLGEICQWALDDAGAAHPECVFDLKTSGDLVFQFDAPRIQQVFSNLLNNAAQYRKPGHPIALLAHGDDAGIVAEVRNFGTVIPPESLEAIFNPLVQLYVDADQKGPVSTSLGLGLFIARQITVAHGGTISAESSAIGGTAFIVRIPRNRGANLQRNVVGTSKPA